MRRAAESTMGDVVDVSGASAFDGISDWETLEPHTRVDAGVVDELDWALADGLTLPEVLHFARLLELDAAISVSSLSGGKGRLWLREGKLIEATWQGRKGLEAAQEICGELDLAIALEVGEVDIAPGIESGAASRLVRLVCDGNAGGRAARGESEILTPTAPIFSPFDRSGEGARDGLRPSLEVSRELQGSNPSLEMVLSAPASVGVSPALVEAPMVVETRVGAWRIFVVGAAIVALGLFLAFRDRAPDRVEHERVRAGSAGLRPAPVVPGAVPARDKPPSQQAARRASPNDRVAASAAPPASVPPDNVAALPAEPAPPAEPPRPVPALRKRKHRSLSVRPDTVGAPLQSDGPALRMEIIE